MDPVQPMSWGDKQSQQGVHRLKVASVVVQSCDMEQCAFPGVLTNDWILIDRGWRSFKGLFPHIIVDHKIVARSCLTSRNGVISNSNDVTRHFLLNNENCILDRWSHTSLLLPKAASTRLRKKLIMTDDLNKTEYPQFLPPVYTPPEPKSFITQQGVIQQQYQFPQSSAESTAPLEPTISPRQMNNGEHLRKTKGEDIALGCCLGCTAAWCCACTMMWN